MSADEVKHTPGPWQAEWPECEGNRYVSSTVTTVCTETAVCVLREDQEADARLIAAAPDLLEALRELNEAFDDGLCNSGTPGFDSNRLGRAQVQAVAAIAKAEGRSNA